ncbi:MAG TPA: hypothetical protein VGU25_02695 [Acidobacteriaceae bacterium]|nr:hypothetical protein [Acidobacteriaceae bacterium]
MRRLSYAILGSTVLFATFLHAQTIGVSCPQFFKDGHQRIACVEALLSQDDYHFTLASLPPSNGFGLGLVLMHSFKSTKSDNEVDLSVTAAGTTNNSWYTGGDIVWSLPFRTSETDGNEAKLASATEKNWHQTAFHFQVAHQSVKTLYFYGIGSRAPATAYVYAEDDTWEKLSGRLPISHHIVLVAENGVQATNLPMSSDPSAITANVPSSQVPGIDHQPTMLETNVGLQTRALKRISHEIEKLPKGGTPHLQPLSQFLFENDATVQWDHPLDGSQLAFRQFRFDGDEKLNLRAWLRNSFVPAQHPFVYHVLCQDSNKQTDECNLGQFDVRSRLILSGTPANNQVPFYLQPTLGGSDIDNNVTLRGWDNYRFRGRDAALLQFESNFVAWDPFGVYLFYDAGGVGQNAGDLSLAHLRQDAGAGASLRIQGSIVAQTYYAWGAGHGGRWGYNFAKVF